MSKNFQNLTFFLFLKRDIFWQFFFFKSSLWQFFNIQIAIFRRVRTQSRTDLSVQVWVAAAICFYPAESWSSDLQAPVDLVDLVDLVPRAAHVPPPASCAAPRHTKYEEDDWHIILAKNKTKQNKNQGDRDDAQEFTAFWNYTFYRNSLSNKYFERKTWKRL